MTETLRQEWPKAIWMAEREDYDQGVVSAVLSEQATIARFEGDKERDKDFHRYVDGDIHESLERYWKAKNEALAAALQNFVNGVSTGAISSYQDETLGNAVRQAKSALNGEI